MRGRPGPITRLWDLARARRDALLATPDGAPRVTRGAAAGAFAAMIPAFGLHVGIALCLALLSRGNLAAAAVTCLLVGNPLTHAFTLPISYALGRWLIPPAAASGLGWLPHWIRDLLPIAEEALAGSFLLGAAVSVIVFFVVRHALVGRKAGRP